MQRSCHLEKVFFKIIYKISLFTYFVFQLGNRNCIGSRFALVQAKFGLATILSNFKLKLSDKTIYPMKVDVESPLLTISGGNWIDLERIK